MQNSFKLFILAALAGIAAAQDSVELCTGANLGGSCVVAANTRNKCNNVGAAQNDQISSIHLGAGTACRFWADGNCQGNSIIVRTDVADLSTLGFNDVISSFTCFPA
ncbi:hypothetical protein HGRIS_014595 [Hohenbuehelia grisea]|uniref:Uncharacterized protein n=1 Tax=Hohenbuehelia grisea TaxID=104357 RepID=A0ABR3JUK2_9AGAR